MNAKQGLSLIEVMLAVLIVGISVTTLLALQGKLSRGVFLAHGIVERIPFIMSYFVSAEKERLFEDQKAHKKDIQDPELAMTYSASKATSRSLASFQHLVIEKIDASWPTVLGPRNETFAVLRFAPRPAKKPAPATDKG